MSTPTLAPSPRLHIRAGSPSEKQMLWQTVIHVTFLISAVAIAAVERILPDRQPH